MALLVCLLSAAKRPWVCGLLIGGILMTPNSSTAQEPAVLPPPIGAVNAEQPSPEARDKEARLIEEVLDAELVFRVDPARSKVVRTRQRIQRLAVTDPSVVEVNEFGPNEFEVIGQKAGETTMTIWFEEEGKASRIIRYLVRVASQQSEQFRAEIEYAKLQSRINELFPHSQVQLIPVADKLIVRGQVRDSQEAAQILALLGGPSGAVTANAASGDLVNVGGIAKLPGADDLSTSTLINLLRVPGEQQVMLKVRIAELSRNAARELGMDFEVLGNSFSISNFIGGAGNLSAILDHGDVQLFMNAFSTHGYGKILAEPNLVTLSGQPATFIAGGEFAVPTAVGVDGVSAVTTTFRGFGTQLAFTPTVIDKDRIRLHVAPSFSSLNTKNAVNGIPGLDLRAVRTTVDLREGQWLAIAGLIQDEQGGTRSRIPYLGDIPFAGALLGRQGTTRDETELIVLVSPELVHPLEPDQAPTLLPGMSVTDPTNCDFYGMLRIEGLPDAHHRSTVWPAYQHRMRAARRQAVGRQSYYVCGPQGFTE